MRLLNVHTRMLEAFFDESIPPYYILSHTWGEDEVSFQELHSNKAQEKKGHLKIDAACKQTLCLDSSISYIWIDTCCIDKTSSAELSEAINSMFFWYQQSAICYAYLADVQYASHLSDESDVATSRWFSRGWTLQELLAPTEIIFFTSEWSEIGKDLRWRDS